MGNTPNFNIPYPDPTSAVDVAGDLETLATFLDSTVLPDITVNNIKIKAKLDPSSTGPVLLGDPVYLTGVGYTPAPDFVQFALVKRSIASNSATFPSIGIAETTLNTTDMGEVVVSGPVDANFDTSSWPIGTVLYVSATPDPGRGSGSGLTSTPPVYPNVAQAVAVVTKRDAAGNVLLLSAGGGGGGAVGGLTWGQLKG